MVSYQYTMGTKTPHLLVEAGDLNETALLPGDPGRVEAIAEYLDDVEDVTKNREYRVVNGSYQGTPVTVCSTGVGCPSAAIAVEELVDVGVERFLRVGTTGALQPDIDEGDVVVASAAAKYEGTTTRYEDLRYPAVASIDVVDAVVDAAEANDERVRVGPVVTDDAYYAEDEEIADDWMDAGMVAVEMEAAAIFTLARRHGLEAGAILAVDGNLVRGEQKTAADEDEFTESAKEGIRREIEVALDAVKNLEA